MMQSIRSARAGFTQEDLRFIESLHDASHSVAIRHLLHDPECLQELLDQPEIRRALLESPVALPVSASLYFYTLVRHALLDGGVDHIGITDHIAGVLVDKLDGHRVAADGPEPWTTHAVDYIARIQHATGLLKVHLEVTAGDQFLVLTGLFHDFIEKRSERCGSPGVQFYDCFARQSYHHAAQSRSLSRQPSELFGLLAEVFPIARSSLNKMREHCLFLGA